MKIRLTTIREIPDDEYWHLIVALRYSLPWLNGQKLLKKGKQTYSSEDIIGLSKTSATTTIEIMNETV